MSTLAVWLEAARPRTLPAAAAPVVMGTALAYGDGMGHAPSALAALLGALFIQIGTNFANDYYDYHHGADVERRGPVRATQAGLVRPQTMRAAFVIAFGLATLAGAYLVARSGWPIVAIGLSAIAAGVLYTAGPHPLGYLGLGDILVVIFFGPVAVAGTYYAITGHASATSIVAGLAPGFLSVALLAVNNLRDADTDRKAGKATLAVRFGARFVKTEYTACLAAAAAIPIVLWLLGDAPPLALAASAACLAGIPPLGDMLRARPGDRLHRTLGATGRLLALYAAAFSLGWVIR